VENLDLDDETFDVVLCTQVLEHVRRPHQALLEMARVLRPGGVLLMSTHGVYPFHPDPNDYWRWTQQGFEAMFEDVESLQLAELHPHTGAPATFAMLMAGALHDLASTMHVRGLATPLIAGVNLAGRGMDRVTSESVRMRLVGNFLAVARKV
jgi:SAM-dependent methyltransferase